MPHFITFQVDNQDFALPLDVVERVIQVIEMRTLPKMPKFLHGFLNLFGEIIPLINIHFLFGCTAKEIELSDQIIIAKSTSNSIAVLVDEVRDVIELSDDEIINSDELTYSSNLVKGIVKLDEGMLLINDLDSFLDEDQLKFIMEAISSNYKTVTL